MSDPIEIFIGAHRSLMTPPISAYRFGISDSSRGFFNYETGEMFLDSKRSLVGKIDEFSPIMSPSSIVFSFSLSAIDGSFELQDGFSFLEFIKVSHESLVPPAYFLLRRKTLGNEVEGHYEGIWAFPGEDFSRLSGMPKDEKRLILKGVGALYASMTLYNGKEYSG